MISFNVYLPALGGIRFRTSGIAGIIGRMNEGILSHIVWTPAMISLASFSSILLPLGPARLVLGFAVPTRLSSDSV